MRHVPLILPALLCAALLACSGSEDTLPPVAYDAPAGTAARADSLADVVAQLERQLTRSRAEVARLSAAARAAGASDEDARARSDTDDAASPGPRPLAPPTASTARGDGPQRLLRFTGDAGATITYVGDVRDGKAHGYGHALWSTGTSYEGTWADGKRSGFGTQRYADDERFEGQFVDDKRTGEGTYFYRSGQRWVGPWQDNLRHGTGTLYEADGRVRVKGVWERDKLVREIKD
jgi:hypothetical protein